VRPHAAGAPIRWTLGVARARLRAVDPSCARARPLTTHPAASRSADDGPWTGVGPRARDVAVARVVALQLLTAGAAARAGDRARAGAAVDDAPAAPVPHAVHRAGGAALAVDGQAATAEATAIHLTGHSARTHDPGSRVVHRHVTDTVRAAAVAFRGTARSPCAADARTAARATQSGSAAEAARAAHPSPAAPATRGASCAAAPATGGASCASARATRGASHATARAQAPCTATHPASARVWVGRRSTGAAVRGITSARVRGGTVPRRSSLGLRPEQQRLVADSSTPHGAPERQGNPQVPGSSRVANGPEQQRLRSSDTRSDLKMRRFGSPGPRERGRTPRSSKLPRLDAELERLRKRLGLDRSQNAELLREVAGWPTAQPSARGRSNRPRPSTVTPRGAPAVRIRQNQG
jgi:hypothetical protein